MWHGKIWGKLLGGVTRITRATAARRGCVGGEVIMRGGVERIFVRACAKRGMTETGSVVVV